MIAWASVTMTSADVADLAARRDSIRTRWTEVLGLDRASSALASPEILVYMIDHTLDDLFAALARQVGEAIPAPPPATCACGRNPYLQYFAAGRQAVLEALVLGQSIVLGLNPAERDLALRELERAYNSIEREHIENFCAICQFNPARGAPANLASLPAWDR